MDDVAALVTTRLASLCLKRGRPRRLTFDDHLVRAALVVDLAIGGRGDLAVPTLAVLALGRVSALFGRPDPRTGGDGWTGVPGEPQPWVLDDMGEAAWAGRLAVGHLLTVGTHMRAVGNAVD
jgi:hypothetical protein